MRKALFLTAVGAILCRLVPHPPNAVPMRPWPSTPGPAFPGDGRGWCRSW